MGRKKKKNTLWSPVNFVKEENSNAYYYRISTLLNVGRNRGPDDDEGKHAGPLQR